MTPRVLLFFALAGWFLLFSAPMAAAQSADAPILRIETDFHTAMIKASALSADGTLLLTPSDDKTARLWRLPDFTLLRTFRPPIGEGDEGKLYAAALSPDGKLAAVGGWSKDNDIYVFSTVDGRLLHRLGDLPNVVNILAFSPDGTRLAAGLGGSNGIRVWRVEGWREITADKDYGGQVYGLSFSRDGRLATGSYDGSLRLYGPDLTLRTKAKLRGGERPYRVAFSPDGRHLAVGFEDAAQVEVVEADTLRSLAVSEDAGSNLGLSEVAWSRDGTMLLAGGRGNGPPKSLTSWPWRNGTLGPASSHSVPAQDVLMGLLSRPSGEWVVISGDPMLTHLNKALAPISHRTADIRDFRDSDLRLSADGTRVGFGLRGKAQRFTFDVTEQRLRPQADAALAAPRLDVLGMVIENWRDNRSPRLNGKALKLHSLERSSAAALSDQALLLGASWSLRRFDRAGEQKWERPVPATTWAVNISGDNRLAVAAHADGTIRWYHMDDKGKELLALFPHSDGTRWVAWTPSGYYAASAGAEDLIGWHVNRGPDQAADFYPIGLFRDRFNRPDVVALVLRELDEAKALAKADSARFKVVTRGPTPAPASPAMPLVRALPPVVDILSPTPGSSAPDGRLTLQVRVRAPADAPAHRLRVQRDGSLGGYFDLEATADGTATREISLPPSPTVAGPTTQVSIIAYNQHGASAPAELVLTTKGSQQPERKPDLYVLAVGIDDYPSSVASVLHFAGKDASDFTEAMIDQEGILYRKVIPHALPNARRQDVLDGLKWLESKAERGDYAMVFLSGHGHSDAEQNFFFMTPDSDLGRMASTTVTSKDILSALGRIKGKRFVFIDACRSGAMMPGARGKSGPPANLDRFINELRSTEGGSVVFAASQGREESLEHPDWKNGAFTKALVAGLRGDAAHPKDGDIRVHGLFDWVDREVRRLTEGRQMPTLGKPETSANFLMALKR